MKQKTIEGKPDSKLFYRRNELLLNLRDIFFETCSVQALSNKLLPFPLLQDLYTWVDCFQTLPSNFSLVLDRGTILKDLS